MTDWSTCIRDEVLRAARVVGAPLDVVDQAAAVALRHELCARYCEDFRLEFGRNNLNYYAAVHDPASFLWAARFLGDSVGYMLYDSSHAKDQYVFRVPNGQVLRAVLEECFGFQFYVTDECLSFVLCLTDDDCLMGCGRARSWVESFRANMRRSEPE
ncbi:hypothetical protein [Sorangium sp. So ce1151]|uniref:hypothetical protein n=1 Tax=Sorangium sp. So ce1151 TaxID=3133332 RepID=UPI003F5E131C